MESKTIKCSVIIIVVALGTFLLSCIPGVDDKEIAIEEGKYPDNLSKVKEDDWFIHTKVEKLIYNTFPDPELKSKLPRKLGSYSLGGIAPKIGSEFRDNQKILFFEEKSRERRMRLFSRDGIIFRIQTLTQTTLLDVESRAELWQMVRDKYGPPQGLIEDEYIYLDSKTVLQFKLGGDFLITDMKDIETCELPPHIMTLIDENYENLK